MILPSTGPPERSLFELVTSVPGVGPVVATELILSSDDFKAIDDPKKLACHAGVAPIEHASGSSVRGKTRVNHQAPKFAQDIAPYGGHVGASSQRRASAVLSAKSG